MWQSCGRWAAGSFLQNPEGGKGSETETLRDPMQRFPALLLPGRPGREDRDGGVLRESRALFSQRLRKSAVDLPYSELYLQELPSDKRVSASTNGLGHL